MIKRRNCLFLILNSIIIAAQIISAVSVCLNAAIKIHQWINYTVNKRKRKIGFIK